MKPSRYVIAVAVFTAGLLHAAEKTGPFESGKDFRPFNRIDKILLKDLEKKGIEPARICSDAVFIRRVHIDLAGILPDPKHVIAFLKDRRRNKYEKLVDELMEKEEFVDYWTHKWGDVLRMKAEFPINLWPNGVQAYSRWVHEAVRDNMPYDKFAKQLLTSSGSNFRTPQVNFYRAVQGHEPSAMADAVALTFMGSRIERWPENRRKEMEVFFSRVAFKGTAEWKEEIVYLDPALAGPLKTAFPDGKKVVIPAGKDPREVFADWLVDPDNPWFARAVVNRLWAWMMGRGIVHQPDDIREDNKPVNPELLDCLAKVLVKSDYDLKSVIKLIANSGTYRQSPICRGKPEEAEKNFACYPVRRLDAEVLVDAMNWISGSSEDYTSLIPEPYTFVPSYEKTIELEDGSITSQFLEMFGRPSRDTGTHAERNNKPDDAQSLHLLNSSAVQKKIQDSWRLKLIDRRAKRDAKKFADMIYLTILSRLPTDEEVEAAGKYMKEAGHHNGAVDLAWALVNGKEFLYRH